MKNQKSLDALARYRANGGRVRRSKASPRRSRPAAIRVFCLECVGDVAYEVALCTGGNCPLWEWRFASHYSTPGNIKRVQRTWEAHRDAVKEAEALGLDTEFYTNSTPTERERYAEEFDHSIREKLAPGSWRTLGAVFDDSEKSRDVEEVAINFSKPSANS